MKLQRLMSTYEVLGVRSKAKREVQWDIRVEVFMSPEGVFSCRVWIIDEFRIIPTDHEYDKIAVGNPDCYADKVLLSEMDAHEFRKIRGSSEEDVKEKAMDMIRELFDVNEVGEV